VTTEEAHGRSASGEGEARSHGLRVLEYLSKLFIAIVAILLLIAQSV